MKEKPEEAKAKAMEEVKALLGEGSQSALPPEVAAATIFRAQVTSLFYRSLMTDGLFTAEQCFQFTRDFLGYVMTGCKPETIR